jgi:hypothetical protein
VDGAGDLGSLPAPANVQPTDHHAMDPGDLVRDIVRDPADATIAYRSAQLRMTAPYVYPDSVRVAAERALDRPVHPIVQDVVVRILVFVSRAIGRRSIALVVRIAVVVFRTPFITVVARILRLRERRCGQRSEGNKAKRSRTWHVAHRVSLAVCGIKMLRSWQRGLNSPFPRASFSHGCFHRCGVVKAEKGRRSPDNGGESDHRISGI